MGQHLSIAKPLCLSTFRTVQLQRRIGLSVDIVDLSQNVANVRISFPDAIDLIKGQLNAILSLHSRLCWRIHTTSGPA